MFVLTISCRFDHITGECLNGKIHCLCIENYSIGVCNRWCYPKEMRERGAIVTNEASVIRAGKLILLVISNEDRDDIIRIIK